VFEARGVWFQVGRVGRNPILRRHCEIRLYSRGKKVESSGRFDRLALYDRMGMGCSDDVFAGRFLNPTWRQIMRRQPLLLLSLKSGSFAEIFTLRRSEAWTAKRKGSAVAHTGPMQDVVLRTSGWAHFAPKPDPIGAARKVVESRLSLSHVTHTVTFADRTH
jgi:hypothetical protein